jgi:hypothetical protein
MWPDSVCKRNVIEVHSECGHLQTTPFLFSCAHYRVCHAILLAVIFPKVLLAFRWFVSLFSTEVFSFTNLGGHTGANEVNTSVVPALVLRVGGGEALSKLQ